MVRNFLILFFLMGLAVASAQPGPLKVLVATGKEVQVESLNPGYWDCDGGQRTTTGPPCSTGTKNIWVWGLSSRKQYQDLAGSAADLLNGDNVTSVNGTFDGNYFGHMYGTFQWTVPGAGGTWFGTFSATADQMRGLLINRAVGYGAGGKLEGLKLEYYAVSPGSGQAGLFVAQVTSK